MPEITIRFDDIQDASAYLQGPKYYSVLHDLYQELRTDTKHGEGNMTQAYDLLLDLLSQEKIDLFE